MQAQSQIKERQTKGSHQNIVLRERQGEYDDTGT